MNLLSGLMQMSSAVDNVNGITRPFEVAKEMRKLRSIEKRLQ